MGEHREDHSPQEAAHTVTTPSERTESRSGRAACPPLVLTAAKGEGHSSVRGQRRGPQWGPTHPQGCDSALTRKKFGHGPRCGCALRTSCQAEDGRHRRTSPIPVHSLQAPELSDPWRQQVAARAGREESPCFMGRASVWEDEKPPEMDGGDVCTT